MHYHKPVAFIILPLFALANTCIKLIMSGTKILQIQNSIGILTGWIGNHWYSDVLFYCDYYRYLCMPSDIKWKHIAGASCLPVLVYNVYLYNTSWLMKMHRWINDSNSCCWLHHLLQVFLGFIWLKISLQKQHNNPEIHLAYEITSICF